MKTRIFLRYILGFAAGLLVMTSCNKELDFGYDIVFVTGTEDSPIVKFVVDGGATYSLTVSATDIVKEDVTVKLAIDPKSLTAYNKANKTTFKSVDPNDVELETTEVVIPAGWAVSNAIQVKLKTTENLEEGPTYVIPIVVTEVKGSDMRIIDSSNSLFLRIARTISFNSLSMDNSGMYSNYIFDNTVTLTNYTCEIKVYCTDFSGSGGTIRRVCDFTNKVQGDGSIPNMLRFGEHGREVNALQWVSPGGGVDSKTLFEANRWYTISLVFDGTTYSMYIDGVKDGETGGSVPLDFDCIELGMSWAGYRGGQRFPGRIAEMRVWNRALGASEIKLGLCAVDPEAEGLLAYWRLNEGEGHIFRNSTKNAGYDIDWSDTWRCPRENDILEQFDYSGQVRWNIALDVEDEPINKCS